ncbi:uncharacterized protein DUF992 [Dongia mobilis]|jgi:hypothetical protein|uniref:Uncharacterized protein DUF992 n=1 Tax=Dongia mobilis TaxID=578943 RepID=A0A4R6WPY8_9PROT|nr:DUF992 domain-containing protein [Dongia mobilis]TDQ81559.1 uncharacterized protein DUF992 [Dongia mobilis]
MIARSLIAAAAALMICAAPAGAASGVNVGSLSCKVSGGVGFIFGSSKSMNCVFSRVDGTAEVYNGDIDKYGVDIGFTSESHMIWAVFAPGNIAPGALAGNYGGATADVAAGLGLGANVLVGGSNQQIALQPVSVTGNVGLNVAAGVAQISLRPGI